MPGPNGRESDPHCCPKVAAELKVIRESQIRMEQKAQSSWDPAALQTWRNKRALDRIRGALILSGAILTAGGLIGALALLFGGGV